MEGGEREARVAVVGGWFGGDGGVLGWCWVVMYCAWVVLGDVRVVVQARGRVQGVSAGCLEAGWVGASAGCGA